MAELLFQKRDAYMLQECDFSSGVRLVVSGQYPEQRGLARPVWGNQRDFVSFVDIEPDMLEKHLRAVTLAYVFNLQV